MNTFYFECNDEVVSNIILDDEEFNRVHDMSFDDLMNYDKLGFFVNCMVETAKDLFENIDDGVFITLADDNDNFIWSIDIEKVDKDSICYTLTDWLDDDGKYCYKNS